MGPSERVSMRSPCRLNWNEGEGEGEAEREGESNGRVGEGGDWEEDNKTASNLNISAGGSVESTTKAITYPSQNYFSFVHVHVEPPATNKLKKQPTCTCNTIVKCENTVTIRKLEQTTAAHVRTCIRHTCTYYK